MNWDAIGAIAEMVGALGVIASLGYLAVQIRQSTAQSRTNTTAIEGSAFQQALDHHNGFNLKLIEDPELLKTLLTQDLESVDPLEKQRFMILISSIIRSHFNAWSLYDKGLISQAQLSVLQSGIRRMLGGPFGAETWRLRRSEYPPDFAETVDGLLKR